MLVAEEGQRVWFRREPLTKIFGENSRITRGYASRIFRIEEVYGLKSNPETLVYKLDASLEEKTYWNLCFKLNAAGSIWSAAELEEEEFEFWE